MVHDVKNGQHEPEFVVTPRGLKWQESVISSLMDHENDQVESIFPALWVSDDP